MIRLFRLAVLGLVLALLVLLALANRGAVEIALLPAGLPMAETLRLNAPLFLIVFAALLLGLLLGIFFEYFREYKLRRAGSQAKREASQLAGEVKRLKSESGKDDDDVLALLN